MVKRKLNNSEMMLANKSLQGRKEEKEWVEYQLLYYDLMLSKGLEMNYKKTLKEFKGQKSDYEGQLKMVNDIIKTLQEQMRNGVEVKEESKEDTKEEDKE